MAKGTQGNGAAGRASTKGRVHDKYSQRLDDLKGQAKEQYDSFTGDGPRPWQHPTGFTGSTLAIKELGTNEYDREEINTNFEECLQKPEAAGTVGDVIALTLQVDHLAAQERAYRHRHATLVRCMAHAMGRRCGQGNGPLFGRVRKEVEDFVKAGGAS